MRSIRPSRTQQIASLMLVSFDAKVPPVI